MIKVTIISMGRLKEKFFCAAQEEYAKRLSSYCNLEIIEIPPENLPESPSKSLVEAALLKEAEKIEKRMPKSCLRIALCVEGKRFTSEALAEKIENAVDRGNPICFIIGSSYGLHSSVKEKSDLKMSLSDMTFPHRLFRIMLLEQIYRSFKINEGGTYHK